MQGSRQLDYLGGAVKLRHWELGGTLCAQISIYQTTLGGGGGLEVDPRQAEDDGHQYRPRPGSNLGGQTGSVDTSFSRKVPVKV